MEEYIIDRDGQAPAVFDGEIRAEAYGARANGKERNRYYHLILYTTRQKNWVLQIDYRTRWEGERSRSEAMVFQAVSEIGPWLQQYDPLRPVRGYPPGASFVARQQALEKEITSDFRGLISELLSLIPESAERIE